MAEKQVIPYDSHNPAYYVQYVYTRNSHEKKL